MHEELLATAIAAAQAGAEVVSHYFRGADLDVRRKAENDFVTRADKESEEAIVRTLLARHPDHRILGEEGGSRVGGGGDHEWVIDPLDGTPNFLQGLPLYCVSVACRKGET